MPGAKETSLTIARTVVPQGPTLHLSRESVDIHGVPGAWMGPALVLARTLAMVAVAAFAILVILPAAVALQATLPS
jgi:hypothetical protein